MAQATLDQVISQLDALKPEELQQLEDAVRTRLRPALEQNKSKEEKEAAFNQAMLAAGLISRIKPPRTAENAERPLLEVQGEPLSETIIRERR